MASDAKVAGDMSGEGVESAAKIGLLNELMHAVSAAVDEVREGVAMNPSTPVEVLELLAGDEYEDVRVEVARNPSVPVEVLEVLAGDEYEDVRVEVARNPSVPVAVLEVLARDQEVGVHVGVAGNPKTPHELRFALLGELARGEISTYRRWVLSNPSTPLELLLAISRESRDDLRASPHTSASARDTLGDGKFFRLTENEWREHFSPKPRSDCDGDRFYGEDEDDRAHVEAQPATMVWSEIYSFDHEAAYLVNGYIDVEDGVYYVCEVPWVDGCDYEVLLNEFSGDE